MAKINFRSVKEIEKERNTVHNEVDATYTSFTDRMGNKYFQVDTYGSKDRQFQGKISQSFQIEEKSALELIRILMSEFNIKKI
ncbi:methionyl-tRNA formyltransferase [Bacillus sp. FJAT-45066]|uniref:methionyl-tRNA formyltransferase n=1 Tax=Bacillus sp. FJAT-45066 TaxID=2011010 RepID=UPI000BB82764|nr:methionyl-tRNA formyltransferase [Bacillus sp. FJAT-45066]